MAMMLNNITQENDECFVMKYEEVETFLRSLVTQLPCYDGINNLEKELRFLLTFLRDTAFIGCDEHQGFKKLLPEVNAVANEVKSLLGQQTDEGLAAALNHFDLITPKITDFLNLLPSIRRSVCTTPKFSALDSLPIVDSLTRDLEDIITGEDNRVYEAMDQIEVLYNRLKKFQSSIKGIECLQHSVITELKQALLQIGHMALEAEYLLVSFSVGAVPLWYLHNRLTHINHEIQLIGNELQQITEMYKSGETPSSLPAKSKINIAVDQVTIGFEDKTVEVLELLIGEAESLKVISIIGMAGLGKTTLARKLYNHSLVNYRFDKISWCVVSQTYLRRSILIDMLMQIDSELDKNKILKMEEEGLAEHVYKTLKGRRYLIVMDDVWGSDVWYNFQRCFPDDGNGSRILFTSRNKNAAPPNSIVYAMNSMSNDQCWELLEKKVFQGNGCPPHLLAIGKKIAATCSGLPLSVVVIAGILSTLKSEKSTWEEVGGNLASYIFDGGDHSVMQILELSYKHLPLHLKTCFLYLARFKEDEEINARKLMRFWIAERFISKEKEKHVEDVAEEYLMELIDKSLVMVGKRRSDGGVKTCTVHDLLHDFCLKRCSEENFIMFEENYGYEKGIRLQVAGGPISRRCCQQVRSIYGHVSLPSNFDAGDLRLLRLVDVYYKHLVSRPWPWDVGIEHEFLVNLRFLRIDETYFSERSLLKLTRGLVKLEHLFVKTRVVLGIAPATVKMRKLRILQVGGYGARYDEDWNSSSHTTNLEYLSNIVIGDCKDEEALRCSPHLRKLKCVSPQSLEERMEYRHFDLSFLTKLESLNVVFNVYQMKGIIYPANLKKLTLAQVVLTRKKISMIGGLENLVVLKLERKCMFAGAGEDWDTRDGEFQKLRFLKLQDMPYFRRWNVASSQHFPQLQKLVLYDCYSLRGIPSEIGEITTLQLIELRRNCLDMLVRSARQIQEQQLEMGNEDLRVVMLDIRKIFTDIK